MSYQDHKSEPMAIQPKFAFIEIARVRPPAVISTLHYFQESIEPALFLQNLGAHLRDLHRR